MLGLKKENERLTVDVKEAAMKSGASLVGIVSSEVADSVPKIWVGWKIQEYTRRSVDVMADAKSIVVLGYHVWDDMLELAIKKNGHWAYPGYSPLEVLEEVVGNYLEKRGYRAIISPPIPQKRLAQLAGLGSYGKNALIINPIFGPWIRLATILTNADMIPNKPFEQNLCGECAECVKACPAGALTPYKVDDGKCLVGVHLVDKENFERNERWKQFEPKFTENAHLMCTVCQKACKYGREKH